MLSLADFENKYGQRGDKRLQASTIKRYYGFLNKHFELFFGTKDWDEIVRKCGEIDDNISKIGKSDLSLSNKITLLQILWRIHESDKYSKCQTGLSEIYKNDCLKRVNVANYDWETTLRKFDRVKCKNWWYYQRCVLANLMFYHPRRVQDYALLRIVRSDEVELSSESNYYLSEKRELLFFKFKNSESGTAGEMRVQLDDRMRELMDDWMTINKTVNVFVSKKKLRLSANYLCKLIKFFGLPTTTRNRKIQESVALANGEDALETSKRFNHSIATQQVVYKKVVE
jgi:hypothetical protein